MYIRGFGAAWFMVRVEMKRKILLFVAAVSEKLKTVQRNPCTILDLK